MRILCENIQHNTFTSLIDNLRSVGDIGVIKDSNNIATAMNEFKPHLLILKEENITGIVKAYSDKNKTKIISFGGSQDKGDINLRVDIDIPMANLDIIAFKEDVDKTDISVFANSDGEKFISEFLCKNYNVNAYGHAKINSPRYLGITNNVEKYEILNKSKLSIVFNLKDAFDSVLLDTYPIVYGPKELEFKTFQNMTSLMDIIESMDDETDLQGQIDILKSEIRSKNSITFTRDILSGLGFNEEATKMHNTLQEKI